MKTLRNIALVAIASAAVSCNLDKVPYNAVNTDNSIESVNDVKHFITGLYSDMKFCTTGSFVYNTELQTDQFHALKNFGNFEGDFYHYSVTASNDMANTAWFGIYGYISNTNFVIEGIEKLMDRGGLSADEIAALKEYLGVAHYVRAHLYFNLSQYFCVDYDKATAASNYGVPVVTKYAPTADSEKYPHRGTLEATYQQILSDLKIAGENVSTAGKSLSDYITKDVVTALQARVALTMEDYETALSKSVSLINSGKYKLVSDRTRYAQGWIDDDLSETIWRINMVDEGDLGNSFRYFIYNTSGADGKDNPQYVPEDWVLDLYDKVNDIRYDAYFNERSISTPVVGTLTLMIKYPGNPALYSTVTNYVNKPKVFRIGEMYLIAAEAAANIPGKVTEGSDWLNALRTERINGWTKVSYPESKLMGEIRDERVRELFCEGFRLNDLKRWHLGFSRSEGQNPALVMQGENYAKCVRPADDPMFVWPIPTSEMEANPQIRGEQNAGYTTDK